MTEKRTKEIKIRLTLAEHAALINRCDRPQLAEWLRELGVGELERRPVRMIDPALLRQLAAIGNNLNQLARWANTRKPIDCLELTSALIALSRELEGIRSACQN